MNDYPLLHSLLTGVAAGLLVSIPVGPINLTVINEGAQHGFRRALLIGFGAVAMETIYCALGFAGFSGFLDQPLWRAGLELVSFLLMLWLGIKYLFTRTAAPVSRAERIGEQIEQRIEREIEQRLRLHTAFLTGFLRVLANPAVILLWITLAGNFISRAWVEPTWLGKSFCIAGVAAGCTAWFAGLSYAASLGHQRVSDHTLVRLARVSGALLLGFAIYIGYKLVLVLAQNPEMLEAIRRLHLPRQ
jgi:threonine/homoserine/homoserine lactone efflux protein